jgi:membrane-associated phospholipid phosphatase
LAVLIRVGVALTGLLVLLTLLIAIGWGPLVSLDDAVARWAYDATSGSGSLTSSWVRATDWGSLLVMRAVLVAVGVGLLVRRRWYLGAWIVLLAGIEWVVAPASKLLLGRPRPSWDDPIVLAGSTSFPSGHAAAAGTAAAAVASVVWAVTDRWN